MYYIQLTEANFNSQSILFLFIVYFIQQATNISKNPEDE
jgi:hypothetical protein